MIGSRGAELAFFFFFWIRLLGVWIGLHALPWLVSIQHRNVSLHLTTATLRRRREVEEGREAVAATPFFFFLSFTGPLNPRRRRETRGRV